MKFTILIFCSLLLAACRAAQAPSEPTALDETIPADERLVSFFQGMEQVTDYQLTVTSTTSGETATYYVEHQAPHVTRTTTQGDNQNIQFIYHKNDRYFKTQKQDTWYKLPLDKFDQAREFMDIDIYSWAKGTNSQETDLTYQGEVDCQELRCYQYIHSDASGTQTVIAFDTKDHLLQNILISDPETTTTIDYEYNRINISLPTNYEEIEIPENPTQQDILKLQKIYSSNN